MKNNDFLVTTTVNGKSWQVVWDSTESLELDFPVNWEIMQKDDALVLRHLKNGTEHPVGDSFLSGKEDISLPLAAGERRQVTVNLKPLQRIRAAFLTSAEAMKMVGPADHYLSGGIREHLIGFWELKDEKFSADVVGSTIFTLNDQAGDSMTVVSNIFGVRFKPLGEASRSLVPGHKTLFTKKELLYGSFIYGSYWWRVSKVPSPEMLDLEELDNEAQAQDLVSLQKLSRGVGICMMLGLLVIRGMYYFDHQHEVKKIAKVTEVELKKPKLIAKAPELPKPTPVPVAVATPTPPPKIMEPPKPKIAKKEPPKVEPVKKPLPPIVKKEPPKIEPPKVVKQEPIKPLPKVAQVPVPQKKPPPAAAPLPVPPAPTKPIVAAPKVPDPSVVKAQQKESLAKSLNFLSTGPTKTVNALATAPNAKLSTKYANSGSGALAGTTSDLSKLATRNTGDGPISTRGARGIASASGIQGAHGKGLNEVQGKVAMNSLYGNGSGDALGAAAGGGGMSVSGPGKISDADIEKTLSKYVEKFQRCYEKALLTDSSLAGEVLIGWTITQSGSVTGAQVNRSEMNLKSLHDCLTGVLSRITFPSPKGGAASVKKPFRFKSSNL